MIAKALDLTSGQEVTLRGGGALLGYQLRNIRVEASISELDDPHKVSWLLRLHCRRVDPLEPIVMEIR